MVLLLSSWQPGSQRIFRQQAKHGAWWVQVLR
jgi:hypothetical protein